MTPPLGDLVKAVRRALGAVTASVDCPCLACATVRLCAAVETSLEDQRTDAAMLVGLADLRRVEPGQPPEEAGP